MSRTDTCHEHTERPLAAWCEHCTRPCCRDCTVEFFDQQLCEKCKLRVADEIQSEAVQPDALRAAFMGALGIVFLGFLLGPYAFWRARMASQLLDRQPWLRGRWHVRAAYVLAALATAQGLVTLAGKFLLDTSATP